MKKISNANKLFISLLIAVSMLLWCFTTIFSVKTFATSSYYGANSVSVTNGNFDDFTKNTDHLPYAIDTGWENIVGLNSTTAYAGIVDTGSNFETNGNFDLPANPGVDSSITNADTSILMIRAKNSDTKYGFESKEITLTKAKYYAISVHAKTGLRDSKTNTIIENTEGFGSIYTTLSTKDENNFLNVATNGIWQTYTMFVETDSFNDAKFTIQLRLGNKTSSSKGIVFFDQVEVKEIANIDYYEAKAQSDTNSRFVSLNEDVVEGFKNASFKDGLTNWTVLNNSPYVSTPTKQSINETLNAYEKTSGINYADNFVYDDGKSLLILNESLDYSKISSATNNNIAISQHGYYRLSMLVKTGSLSSGGLNVTLAQVADSNSITKTQSNLTSSSNGLKSNNNFALVEFYIRGNAYKSEKVSIAFELGTQETKVSGWAIVDNIVLEKISASEYTANTSNDSKVLDLSSKITAITAITNGSFDFVTTSSTDTYPMAPQNWSGENTDLSGVIRVRTGYFTSDAPSYGLDTNKNPGPNSSYDIYVQNGIYPNASTTYENVLMVRTNNTNNAYFKSEAKALSANSEDKFVKFEVGVKTLGSAKAFIKLVDKDSNVIAVYDNISSTANWTKYTLFINNGLSSQDVNFVLGVEGDGNNNYAFFDHAKFTDSLEITKTEILETQNSKFVDLREDSFYSSSNNQVENNVYSAANFSTFKQDENKLASMHNGVANSNYITDLKLRENANDKNILVFSNVVKSYQLLNSNYTYSLTSNNYYEFSVWVKTDFTNIDNGESGAIFEILTLDSESNEIVENSENKLKFYGISTNTEENNGWVKYSIYAVAESDQKVKVVLGLGTQDKTAKGVVYFDDLKVNSISQDEYASKVANDTTIVTKAVKQTNSNNENDSTASSTSTPTDFNFFALFSSIILAVALVLAIAGYLIRRIPKKKTTTIVEKSNYSKTTREVNKKEIKQELKENRENKSNDIEAELEKLKAERQKLKDEYEAASQKEESITNKEKMYTAHTKKVNKLTKQIDYLESALIYVKDASNIKSMENLEIKKRQKQADAEYEKLRKQENESSSENKNK